MIRINLLPFRAARKKEYARKQLNLYGLTVIFLLFAMTYFSVNFNSRLTELWAKQKAVTAECDKYGETNKQLNYINAEIAGLRSKLEVIKVLEKAKKGPVLLLEDIARAVPNERLWLRIITEKDGALSLEGSAMDNDTVALLMTELEKADNVLSVDLVNTKRRKFPQYKINVTNFILSCKTNSFKEQKSRYALENRAPRKARR
jgi:type IV pilus assembly protein PilN